MTPADLAALERAYADPARIRDVPADVAALATEIRRLRAEIAALRDSDHASRCPAGLYPNSDDLCDCGTGWLNRRVAHILGEPL